MLWFGEGDLRYPAAEFVVNFSTAGEFSWTVDVPISAEASGLLIYAWQDLDGDGIFCGLDGSEEFSDLVEVEDYPVFEAVVELQLEQLCQPSEKLWLSEGLVD